jgi:predicted chitinase
MSRRRIVVCTADLEVAEGALMINDMQLRQVMPHLTDAKLQLMLPHLNEAMRVHGIGTMLRTAAFVAQLAHESGEFRFMEEIWGPTAAQARYEPTSDLAARLGNTEAGDGRRFKGRGPIQITGRANYQRYGQLLGADLVAEPELAAQPAMAFRIAGLFWQSNGLNELADAEDFVKITRRINGGTNGLADREQFYARAKAVLAEGFIPDPVVRGRGAPARAAPPPGLTRGYEAIVELAPRKRTRARSRGSQPLQL